MKKKNVKKERKLCRGLCFAYMRGWGGGDKVTKYIGNKVIFLFIFTKYMAEGYELEYELLRITHETLLPFSQNDLINVVFYNRAAVI